MTYVEWLRVRGVLKWTGIVLAALVVVVVIVQYSFLGRGSHDVLSLIHGIQTDSASTVTHATLADGTQRTIIDNRKKDINVVVDDRGYQGKHIEIREGKSGSMHEKTIAIGPINVQSLPRGNGTLTTVDTNQPEDFAYYAAIASVVAMIVGTLLGAPFARENDGHLEIALTKPIGRQALALGTIGVDVAGMAGAWLMTVAFLFIAHSVYEAPHFMYGPYDTPVIVLGFVGALAWYGMLVAATASMKRSYGAVLGLAWPAAIIVALLAKANFAGSQIGQVVHLIATPLSWIDPLSYLHFGPAFTVNGQPQGSMAVNPYYELPMLVLLALVYGALAIIQWRRVEA